MRAIWSGVISFGMVTVPVKMFGATVHRVADFAPETAASRCGRVAREKLAIQPRRSRCCDLLRKGEV